VYSTIRTRIGPNWHVCQKAVPVSPGCTVLGIADQSVTPKGISWMFKWIARCWELVNFLVMSGAVLVATSLGGFVIQSPLQGVGCSTVGGLTSIPEVLDDLNAGFAVAVLG